MYPSEHFQSSVGFVFQSYFGDRLILLIITHFLLSPEKSDLFSYLMRVSSPSPHLICRVWKWLASVLWRLIKRKLPRAWSCWTSSSKLWRSRWVCDLMCGKWLFWIPPRPLLPCDCSITTSHLISYWRYPWRECLAGFEDRKALMSEGVIHSSCKLISKHLLKDLCSVLQTHVASSFLSAEIWLGIQWGQVEFCPRWLLCPLHWTPEILISRNWALLSSFTSKSEVLFWALFSIMKNGFFEHEKNFCRWQNKSPTWSYLLEQNTTSSRIAEAQFPTDKHWAHTTACFFVKT